MKKLVLVLAVLAWTCSNVKAQESGVNFSVGADVVSSYIWRGAYSAKASFQPAASLSVGNFSLSAWGSTEIVGSQKEVDFTLGYSIGNLSLAITDYWWEGEEAFKYFNYKDGTAHLWEGSINYTLPESFPLSLSVNTMFAGNDKRNNPNYFKNYYEEDGEVSKSYFAKKAEDDEWDENDWKKPVYSTYIEAAFPFAIKDVNLTASLGGTIGAGLYADQASVVNIGLKASKEIKISDSFSLPVFGQIIFNPNQENIFFVFGFSL
jgi:hypothetical protein